MAVDKFGTEIAAGAVGILTGLLNIHLFNYNIDDPNKAELVDFCVRIALGGTASALIATWIKHIFKKTKE